MQNFVLKRTLVETIKDVWSVETWIGAVGKSKGKYAFKQMKVEGCGITANKKKIQIKKCAI